ncbi:MAG: flagellin, partial [Acetanaerobacterium sp.]
LDETGVTMDFAADTTVKQQNDLIDALANDITINTAGDGTVASATLGGGGGYTLTAVGGTAVTGEDVTAGSTFEIRDADSNVIATLELDSATAGTTGGDIVISFNDDGTLGADAAEASTSDIIAATAPTAPTDTVEIESGLEITMGDVSFGDDATVAQQNDLLSAITTDGISFTTTSTGAGANGITDIAASLGDYTFSEIDLTSTDAQTLTISDADGNEVGSVSITLNANAATFTTTIDTDGAIVDAEAYTGGTKASAAGLKLLIGASSESADQIAVSVSDMHASGLLGLEDGETTLDMNTADAALAAMDNINAAIETVSDQRATLGAVQNRLEQTIQNLTTTAENMSAAESRIRDVDMAKEMTQFTKSSILSQAAQAMLAQANAQPQGVLQLLG